MKKTLVISSLLLSSFAFADVDYSRCLMASGLYGATIDNDGKLQPSQWQKLKDMKTEGKKETYTFENHMAFGGNPLTTEVVIERDDQGRVIKASTGGDKMDPKALKQYKDIMVQSSVTPMGGYGMGGYFGSGMPTQSPDFMTHEPQFFVDGKIIPLSKLSKEQAKKAGFDGNIENLQKLKQQWRKDKKVVKKIKDGYSKIIEKSAMMVPMGQEAEFEIKDGVCLVKNTTTKNYNTKTKEVVKTPGVSRETCEEIQKIHKKYQAKLNECQDVQMKVSQEYFEKKIFANYGSMGGGYVGGYVGGIVGGMGGGYGMNSANIYQCEMLYGVTPVGMGGIVGGVAAGSTPESNSKQEASQQ